MPTEWDVDEWLASGTGSVVTGGGDQPVTPQYPYTERLMGKAWANAQDELSITERMALGWHGSALGETASWIDRKIEETLSAGVARGERAGATSLDSLLADALGKIRTTRESYEDTRAYLEGLSARSDRQYAAEQSLGITPSWGTLAQRHLPQAMAGLAVDIPTFFMPAAKGLHWATKGMNVINKLRKTKPLAMAMADAGTVFGSYDAYKESMHQANTGEFDPVKILKATGMGVVSGLGMGAIGHGARVGRLGLQHNIIRTPVEAGFFATGGPAAGYAMGDRPSPVATRDDLVSSLGLAMGFGLMRLKPLRADPFREQQSTQKIRSAGEDATPRLTPEQLRLASELGAKHFENATDMTIEQYKRLREPTPEQMEAFEEASLVEMISREKLASGEVSLGMVDEAAVARANRELVSGEVQARDGYENIRNFFKENDREILESLGMTDVDMVRSSAHKVGKIDISDDKNLEGLSFVSPNDADINFTPNQAHGRLGSERHIRTVNAFKEVDRIMRPGPAPFQQTFNAIGEWLWDGKYWGENSSVTRYTHMPISMEQLTLASAAKGYIGNQKEAIAFKVRREDGEDILWRIPTKGKTPEAISKALNDSGVHGRTISMGEQGHSPDTVIVVDQGGKMRQAMKQVATRLGVENIYGTPGEGRFLNAGEEATRQQAREYFKRIVKESDHPDLIEEALTRERADRQRVGERWSEADLDRGPGGGPGRRVYPPGPGQTLEQSVQPDLPFEPVPHTVRPPRFPRPKPVDLSDDPLYFLTPEGKKDYERIQVQAHEIGLGAIAEHHKRAANVKGAYQSVTGKPITNFGGARIFAGGLAKQMKRDGQLRLRGLKVPGRAGAAILAQVIRDPRMETYARFVIGPDGTLLANEYVSSGLPSAVATATRTQGQMQRAFEMEAKQQGKGHAYLRQIDLKNHVRINQWLDRIAKANGLDPSEVRLITAHNHPSGVANPSSADLDVSRHMRQNIPRLEWDVIVDHQHYASVEMQKIGPAFEGVSQNYRMVPRVFKLSPEVTMPGDLKAAPTIPHPALGRTVVSPDEARAVAELFSPHLPDNMTLAFLTSSSSGQLAAVVGIPTSLLKNHAMMTHRGMGKFGPKEQSALVATLRGLGKMHGTEDTIVYYEGSDSGVLGSLGRLVSQGILYDAVTPEGGVGSPALARLLGPRGHPWTGETRPPGAYARSPQTKIYGRQPEEAKGLAKAKVTDPLLPQYKNKFPTDPEGYREFDEQMMARLKPLAERFSRYRDWYTSARRVVNEIAGEDASFLIGLTAASSQGVTPEVALGFGIRAYSQYLTQKRAGIARSEMVFGRTFGKEMMGAKTEKELEGHGLYFGEPQVTEFVRTGRIGETKKAKGKPAAAQKIAPFLALLTEGRLVERDPVTGQETTRTMRAPMDMWMTRLFWGVDNFQTKPVGEVHRRYMQETVARLANDLGWTEGETQAALWSASIMRTEGSKGGGPKGFTSQRVELLKKADQVLNLRLEEGLISPDQFRDKVEVVNDEISKIPEHELVGNRPGTEPVPLLVTNKGRVEQNRPRYGLVSPRPSRAADRRSEASLERYAQTLAPWETSQVLRTPTYKAEPPGEATRDNVTPVRIIEDVSMARAPSLKGKKGRAGRNLSLGIPVDVTDPTPKFQFKTEQYAPNVGRVIRAFLSDKPEQVETQRRGQISADLARKLGAKIGLTAKQYKNARAGFVGPIEVEVHITSLFEEATNLMGQARTRALNATTVEAKVRAEIEIEQQGQLAGMLMMRYMTSGSEHGRSLAHRRHGLFGSGGQERLQKQALRAIMDETKLSEQEQQRLVEMVIKSGGDKGVIFDAIQQAYLPTFFDKFMEVRTSFLLTSPVTYMRNVVGNTLALGSYIAEVHAGVPIDMLYGVVEGKLSNTPTPGRRSPVELWADWTGLMLGVKEGWRLAGRALKDETFAYQHGRIGEEATMVRHAIKGPKGKALRGTFRILSAQDLLFSSILRSAEAYRLAAREAINQKLVGPARTEAIESMARSALQVEEARIRELAKNPELATSTREEIAAGAGRVGLEYTFREKLGDVGQYFNRIRFSPSIGGKFARFMLPFYATPVNLAKFGWRRTPGVAQFASPRNIADLKAGRTQAVDSLARMAVGGAGMSGLVIAALEGYITGPGPKDKASRLQWEKAGNAPYSFRLPDWVPGDPAWRSYRGFSPMTEQMALAAELAEKFLMEGERPSDETYTRAALSIARTTLDQPFLTGAADIFEALRADNRYGDRRAGNMAQNIAAGLVIPRGVAFFARALDPTLRAYPESIQGRMAQEMPWSRTAQMPFRDQLGRTYDSANSLVDAVIRTRSQKPHSPVDDWLFQIKQGIDDAVVEFPSRTVLGSRMDPIFYNQFLIHRRDHLVPMLERAAANPKVRSMEPFIQREVMVPAMVSAVDRAARFKIFPAAELDRLGLTETDENVRRVLRVMTNPILRDQYSHESTSDETKMQILATGQSIRQ